MVYETLMEDEENQIRGYVHLVDVTGVTLPYMTLFTPKEAVRIVKNAEVNTCIVHKNIEGKYISIHTHTRSHVQRITRRIYKID